MAYVAMSSSKRKPVCLLLSLVLVVTGQAPGDVSELCTVTLPDNGLNVFEDPPKEVPLMDTTHYEDFLPPDTDAVWQRVDLDDNNPPGQQTTVSVM